MSAVGGVSNGAQSKREGKSKREGEGCPKGPCKRSPEGHTKEASRGRSPERCERSHEETSGSRCGWFGRAGGTPGKVEERRGNESFRGSVARTGKRRQPGDDRVHLLSSSVQSSRGDRGGRPQRWRSPVAGVSHWHHKRRAPEVPLSTSQHPMPDSPLPRRLSRSRNSRRFDPLLEVAVAGEDRRRRRMGEEPRKGTPCWAGRVGRAEAKGSRAAREPPRERERSKGQEGKEERKREGQRKREEGKEGEKEEGRRRVRDRLQRKSSSGGWEPATGSQQEETPGSVCRNRDGPEVQSKKQGCSTGTKACEEEGQGFFKQWLLQRQHSRLRRDDGLREFVRSRQQGQGDWRSLSRSPQCTGPMSHAGCPPERDRFRGQARLDQGCHAGVLPAAGAEERKWCNDEGDVDDCGHSRLPGPWPGSTGLGHFGATLQELRGQLGRQSLDGLSEAGADPKRSRLHSPGSRVGRSPEGCVERGKDEVECFPAGWPGKRWEAAVQRTRRRKGRSQERERQQGQREQRRQGPEARGWQQVMRDTGEKDLLLVSGAEPPVIAVNSEDEVSSSGVFSPMPEDAVAEAAVHLEGKDSMKGASNLEEDSYEGGMEMAARYKYGTGCSWEKPGADSAGNGELPNSMHVAAALTSVNSFSTSDPSKHGSPWPPTPADLNGAAETLGPCQKIGAFESLTGKFLGECGLFLQQRLLEVLPLRSETTGTGSNRNIFPLPTSRSSVVAVDPSLTEDEIAWTFCVCVSLNSLWGDVLLFDGEVGGVKKNCLEEVMKEVKRFCRMKSVIEPLEWDEFLKVKSIDYKGDEVKVAHWFSWSNISPALPVEVGRVPLEEVCTLGSRHYVEHFDHYLKPTDQWTLVKGPRVMVEDHLWGEVCQGLVSSGVCTWIEESEIFHTSQGPLLNGMFGVSKEDWTSEGVEIFRLIMNLIPLNHLCMPMSGDVDTLPSWGSMSPFFLQPSDNLVVTSEDVKCFFYTMKVPQCWIKFLAFNKPVPQEVLPLEHRGKSMYVASRVLPMGFLNSVSLAQHVHRNLVLWSGEGRAGEAVNCPEAELRKDRAFTSGNPAWRVYLDNYDLLEKVKATEMVSLEGTSAPGVLALRQEYERWEVPRNEKKAVARSAFCEVQGATIDGTRGVAYPREGKLAKYFSLAYKLCEVDKASQKQWQVVCGGLVYFTMFRRPLLGSLNRVWTHVESYNATKSRVLPSPSECKVEVLRLLGMLPLARMDFRLDMHSDVSCSDASTSGGGVCVSHRTTAYGSHVALGGLRGGIPENNNRMSVVTVGLFDGIGALRVALEALGVSVLGHISVEKDPGAQKVVEAHYPGTICVSDVELVDSNMVKEWSARFSQCDLVILGGGPPVRESAG